MPRKLRFPKYPSRAHRSGQARITLAGHDRYLGAHGSPESWAEYNRLLALWRTDGEAGRSGALPRGDQTVADVVGLWLEHAEATYSARGRELEQYQYVLRPLLELYGTLPAAEFNAKRLETLQLAMATGSWMDEARKAAYAKKKLPIGVCRNVVNRRTVRVQTLWKWAEKEGLVPPGSHHNLLTVGAVPLTERRIRKTKRRPPATEEKVRAVLPHIQARRKRRPVAAMLELQWLVGMRSCEVRLLRTCDVDRSDPACWFYRPHQHKNDWRDGAEEAPRVVPLGPECQRVLEGWLNPADPEAYLFRPAGRPGHVCYSAEGYAQAVRRGAEKAGVDLEPYDTRHGAKMRITKALGADAARAVLGQKSISTTAHYGGIDLGHAAEAAKKLG